MQLHDADCRLQTADAMQESEDGSRQSEYGVHGCRDLAVLVRLALFDLTDPRLSLSTFAHIITAREANLTDSLMPIA